MMLTNTDLNIFIEAIKIFCEKERSIARGSVPDFKAANQLRILFTRFCPHLGQQIPDVPDIIYARRIIDFGIAGKKGTITEKIWALYYRDGSTQEALGHAVDFKPRTVKKYISGFAYDIATLIMGIELELSSPIQIPIKAKIKAIELRALTHLQNTYDLTITQANTLLAFCLHPTYNQTQVCEDVLYISENTLKSQKRRIFNKTRVNTMQQIAQKATKALEQRLRGDWKILFDSKQI